MGTSTASRHFNNQYITYTNASSGPYRDITFPFSVAYWLRWDSAPTDLVDYPLGCTDGGTLDTWFGARQGSGNDLMRLIRKAGGGSGVATTNVACAGEAWVYVVYRFDAADSCYFYIEGAVSSEETTSKDLVGNKADLDDISIADLKGDGSFTADNCNIANVIMINKSLTPEVQQELKYNPFSIVDGLLWAPDLLNTSSTIGDFKDLSGNGYTPNAGSSPTTSQLGPPVFLLGGQ